MPVEWLLDLNAEPQSDAAFAYENVAASLPSKGQADHGTLREESVGLTVATLEAGLTVATLEAESGGVTVPTAETDAAGVDVEEGVEVLSTPQEPTLGMIFNTAEAARDYYNSYARHAGFSIRIDTSRESKRDRDKSKYIYVCQKDGVNKKEKIASDGPITEKKIVRQRRRDYICRQNTLSCSHDCEEDSPFSVGGCSL